MERLEEDHLKDVARASGVVVTSSMGPNQIKLSILKRVVADIKNKVYEDVDEWIQYSESESMMELRKLIHQAMESKVLIFHVPHSAFYIPDSEGKPSQKFFTVTPSMVLRKEAALFEHLLSNEAKAQRLSDLTYFEEKKGAGNKVVSSSKVPSGNSGGSEYTPPTGPVPANDYGVEEWVTMDTVMNDVRAVARKMGVSLAPGTTKLAAVTDINNKLAGG